MSEEVVDPVKDLLQIRCVEDPFWAADRIMELENRLTIDLLNPNRRKHIVDLEARIRFLEWALARETHDHWETLDGEGMVTKDSEPVDPGDSPDDYALDMHKLHEADQKELEKFRRDKAELDRISASQATRL